MISFIASDSIKYLNAEFLVSILTVINSLGVVMKFKKDDFNANISELQKTFHVSNSEYEKHFAISLGNFVQFYWDAVKVLSTKAVAYARRTDLEKNIGRAVKIVEKTDTILRIVPVVGNVPAVATTSALLTLQGIGVAVRKHEQHKRDKKDVE